MMIFSGMVTFLKLTGWAVGGLLSTAFVYETGLYKIVRWRKMKTIDTFLGSPEHATVLGITQNGKTFASLKSMVRVKDRAGIFFNVQDVSVPNGFVDVRVKENDWEQVERLLEQKRKINWIPSTNPDEMQKEVVFLINKLYNGKVRNVIVAIDEVHLLEKQSLKACIRLATTGIRWGLYGVFISQRPAKVDNTLYSQSTKHVLFALSNVDYKYLENQSFPSDDIKEVVKGQKYVFAVYDQREVTGAYTIEL
jgi:hypothetical protein